MILASSNKEIKLKIVTKQTLVSKEDLLKLQVEIEKRFNQLILWVVATGIAVAGLILTIMKFY
jgi:hypothetical protein